MDANVQKDEFVKLSLRERLSYGFGDFAQNLVFGTVGGYLLFYMTNIDGISAASGALIFMIVRSINVVWDPYVGAAVDKNNPRAGKYRPYLVYFGVPLVILAAMLFFPTASFSQNGKFIYALISYLATALIYSFVNIPYGSINASLTRDGESIAQLTSTRMMLANTANLLVYTFFPMFIQLAVGGPMKDTGFFGLKLPLGDYGQPGAQSKWFLVYGIYMLIGFGALLLSYFGTRERVLPDENQETVKVSDILVELKSNKALQILSGFFLVAFTFMFFGNTVWPYFMQTSIGHQEWMTSIGLIGSIPGIFLVVLWPRLRGIFGKKGFFVAFLALFIVGQLILWLWSHGNQDNIWFGYIGRFLQQWGLTSATGFMWSLVPEIVTYSEYAGGKRAAGIINAVMGLAFKVGLALGGIVPALLLSHYGFKDASHIGAHGLWAIELSFIWVPIALSIVAGLIMVIYPLKDQDVTDMNKELSSN
ncbi:MAG: MFS transporter [Lactobacillaceae bacterium]|jgi:GPH family glycoside/pentoside/hexuronide:cation symporter|nr:MFS transporter [Lactobacillaceae bacterium]